MASSQSHYMKHFLLTGTSYVLMVSSLSAAAAVGLVAFAILVGYRCIWYGS